MTLRDHQSSPTKVNQLRALIFRNIAIKIKKALTTNQKKLPHLSLKRPKRVASIQLPPPMAKELRNELKVKNLKILSQKL
jgi:hypothetical protein